MSRALGLAALVAFTACKPARTCEAGPQGALLKRMLSADTPHAFSQALGDHGPVADTELPCLTDATSSWFSGTRRNGAQALSMARGNEAAVLAARIEAATQTNDPVVWALLAGGLMEKHAVEAKAALDRPGMVRQALKYENSDDAQLAVRVQATALKAGVQQKLDGIEAELVKRLDAANPEVVQVACEGLTPESARAELPRLKKLLANYEATPPLEHHPEGLFIAILKALIRSGDAGAATEARNALAKGFTDIETVPGSRHELMTFQNEAWIYPEPAVDAFLAGLIRDGDVLAPLAFDVLSTEVSANHKPAGVALVRACEQLMSTPGQTASHFACYRLMFFLQTGDNPISDKAKPKSPPLEYAKAWLAECAKHDCPP
jgi:hypothetical protein